MKQLKRFVLTVFIFFIGFVTALILTPVIDQTDNEPLVLTQTQSLASQYDFNEKKLFDLIQRFRFENNLKPYSKSDILCAFAEERLPEIQQNFSHDAFEERIENNSFTFYYHGLAENLIKENGDEFQTFNGWLHSASHAANLKAPYTHSCVKCNQSTCIQVFGSF